MGTANELLTLIEAQDLTDAHGDGLTKKKE
jgi:hypothetical protein